MNEITRETRLESYLVRPVSRKKAILDILGDKGMTAREIAYAMGFNDLNAVKPRLTEMKNEMLIVAVGKKVDPVTERNVAVWRRRY